MKQPFDPSDSESEEPPSTQSEGHILAIRADGEARRFHLIDAAESWLDAEIPLNNT